jgi:peptide/nickel transport system permease protein
MSASVLEGGKALDEAIRFGPKISRWRDLRTPLGRFVSNKPAVIGVLITCFYIIAAVFAPLICRYSPLKVDTSMLRKSPSATHWFGTDQIGRDQFARVVYGARTSLTVAAITTVSVLLLGVAAGAIAGWKGGAIDFGLMRLVDVILAFPYIILALTLVAIIGTGMKAVIVVFTFVGFGATARLLRGEILRIRNADFIDATRVAGSTDTRIVLRHLLPNTLPVVLTLSVGGIADSVLGEAALSFLGRGIQEPTPSWGLMIFRSKSFFATSPHLLLGPGIALILLTLAVVFIGDGLRDALDPKSDQRYL